MGQRIMSRAPKYVQGFVDRHGRPRFYLRAVGFKRIALPGLPWSPEFIAAYEFALGGELAHVWRLERPGRNPGTINALVVVYYKSDEWNRLTPETQKTRRRIVERFRAQHGDKRVALLQEDTSQKCFPPLPN